jgi:hypothetical protein
VTQPLQPTSRGFSPGSLPLRPILTYILGTQQQVGFGQRSGSTSDTKMGGHSMDTGKMVIGAVVLIGAFVAMAWLGWFGPVTKQFQAIKQNAVQVRR